jgi:hypothetical protein
MALLTQLGHLGDRFAVMHGPPPMWYVWPLDL